MLRYLVNQSTNAGLAQVSQSTIITLLFIVAIVFVLIALDWTVHHQSHIQKNPDEKILL